MGHLVEFCWVLGRRYAQQHAVAIFLQTEEINLRGVGQQRPIVVVGVAIDVVVDGIHPSCTSEEFHLREFTHLLEHADDFLCVCFVAVDGNGGIDDLLHALANIAHVLERDGAWQLHVDVVTIGNGNVDRHVGGVETEVAHCLAEDEEQGADVGTVARRGGDVEKLHRLWTIHTIVHPLHLIIYTCTRWTVFHLQS